jgi:hypothetical protein
VLFAQSEKKFAEDVSRIAFGNPFLPQRVELEKTALGKRFDPNTRPFWSWTLDDEVDRPNVVQLTSLVLALTTRLRDKLIAGQSATPEEMKIYDDLALYVLYYEHFVDRRGASAAELNGDLEWDKFAASFEHWMNCGQQKSPSHNQIGHVYAYLHQLKRAFFNIFHCVIGRSWPIAKLRARIWQSIFTHNMRRSRDTLYNSMNEVTTLVMGATGTGKELVARAVGLSQYVPFDARKKQFADTGQERFLALNLSAFSPTLIESELFGHEKGAFTGALTNRKGWLESAGRYGTVFLDEIGELDLAIQVKLLRVLQNRQFQRTGEDKTRRFEGKFIAATNRNLMAEISAGTFREDFYYRLCSDVIVTPTLVEQLADCPDEFEFLVDYVCHRVAPDAREELKWDVMKWFDQSSLKQHNWPGNMRELEQCVRNVMIHNDYVPASNSAFGPAVSFLEQVQDVALTAEQLLAHYCLLAYHKYGSYEKAAAALQIDRRTVRAKSAQVETGMGK